MTLHPIRMSKLKCTELYPERQKKSALTKQRKWLLLKNIATIQYKGTVLIQLWQSTEIILTTSYGKYQRDVEIAKDSTYLIA